ncbi:MAG: recombinase family protein [bacterium]|nr:recombinase family protein [bacterium]MDY4099961.1 recombinase family protein [Lachnospiraceae bacterium]
MGRRKKERKRFCIAYLCATGELNQIQRKEDKQERYIREYAAAHNIEIVRVLRKDVLGMSMVSEHFGMMAYFIQKGRADGVIVSNMEEVSTSLSDAYEKIGVIREAGGEIISVDQRNLAMEELEAHYEQKTRI